MVKRLTRRQFLWLTGLATGIGLLERGKIVGTASQGPPPGAGVKHGRITLRAADLAGGELQNLILAHGELQLAGPGEGVCLSPAISAPLPFAALGSFWRQAPGGGEVQVALRVSADGVQWSDWEAVAREDAQGPNNDDRKIGALLGLYPTPLPRYVQCRLTLRADANGDLPRLQSLTLAFIDATAGPTTAEAGAAQAAGTQDYTEGLAVAKPPVISRSQWGCPDGQYSPGWPPVYETVTHLFIHHTATPNFQPDWAAWVRSIWTYHALTLQWGDIGYNYLVDPNGYLYEGRAGGDDVIAGHTYGFNDGTLGLAFLGTFSTYSPPGAMVSAAENLLAWKCNQRNIDPTAIRSYLAYRGCSSTTYSIPTILGHRDAPGHNSYTSTPCNAYGPTACPGDALESLIPGIRSDVRARWCPGPSGVSITNVVFTPQRLLSGGMLRIDVTVVNGGCAPLATQGPAPGFIYDEGQSYRSLGYSEVSGAFRVGVDFDGRTQSEDHPYRWGLGGTLAPGASTTVTGYVRLRNLITTRYWVGLVQELTKWWQDGASPTSITVVPVRARTTLPYVAKNS